jgi:hypothetical protein
MTNDQTSRQRFGLIATLPGEFFRRLRWRFGLRLYGVYVRTLVRAEVRHDFPDDFSLRAFTLDSEAELLSLAKRSELQLTPDFVHTALARGDVCSAIIYDDEIVAFDWSAFSATPARVVESVYVDFNQQCRYGYFAYTLPEFRGRHLFRIFLAAKDRYFIERGLTYSIAFIATDNLSSIHYAQANGNRRVGFAGFLQRGLLFIPFRTPGASHYDFRFFRPNLQDKPI